MTSDLLARVRWTNVGIVLLAAGLLALVAGWPLLSPEAPALPRGDAPVVAATPEPEPVARPAGTRGDGRAARARRAEERRKRAARARRVEQRRKRAARAGKRRRRAARARRIGGVRRPAPGATAPAPPPVPRYAPAAPAPASPEFGFEG
ncbi:MAG TPA: hypothetical protein VM266_17455 [Solirubrobacteraceae bacterium]|nr:hypothetical protein [Solirubrobacteraceae bacterium]